MIQHLKIEKHLPCLKHILALPTMGQKCTVPELFRISKMEYITYKVLLFRPCKESPKVHANSIYRPLKANKFMNLITRKGYYSFLTHTKCFRKCSMISEPKYLPIFLNLATF